MYLAPTPVSPSVRRSLILSDFHSVSVSEPSQRVEMTDMEVDMVADMEIDKVANMEVIMTIFPNFDFDADRMEIRKCYGRTTEGQTDRDKC